MTFTVSVQGRPDRQLRRLMRLYRDQVPFATQLALNDTAFSVRKQAVDRWWPQDVNRRNKRFAGAAFRVEKASKTRLQSKVFDRLKREAISWQAEGGTRRGRGNKAIPTRELNRSGRTASGRMRAAQRPTAKNNIRIENAIYKRMRGGKLRYLYTLKPSVRQPRKFKFYDRAGNLARRIYPALFYRSFLRAARTAR